MPFLGFLDFFPDSRTLWLFGESMAKAEKDKIVWREFQRWMDFIGLQVRLGMIQDATFIEADQGSLKKVLATTVKRVGILMMVTAFTFDLYQLCTLKNA
jgi:hypothetical protein